MKTKQIKFSNLMYALEKIYIENEVRNFYKKELLNLIQDLTKTIETDGVVWLPEDYDDYYIEIDNDNILHVNTVTIVLHREMLSNQLFIDRYDANLELAKQHIEQYEELSVDGLNFVK